MPNANPTARFNLNNIGKQVLFLDRGYGTDGTDKYKYGFFKDVTGNGRYLYVIDTYTPLTPDIGVVDISTAPNILNAKFFATGYLGPVIFYATTTTVYYAQYGSNAISIPVAVGGGIRSSEEVRQAYQAGADLVILGNGCEKKPELLREATIVRDLLRKEL